MDYIKQLSLFPEPKQQLDLFLDYDPKEPNYLKVDYQEINSNHLNFCPTLGGFIEVDDDDDDDDDAKVDDDPVENVEDNTEIVDLLNLLGFHKIKVEFAMYDSRPFKYYKGYKIRLIQPNGVKIQGAVILSDDRSRAWQFNSRLANVNNAFGKIDYDCIWHLQQCKRIINEHLIMLEKNRLPS